MNLTYASVCSGIEAASVAWHPLGWRCAFVAEIEKFPSAVLAHHWPQAPNLGNIRHFKKWPKRCDCRVKDHCHSLKLKLGGHTVTVQVCKHCHGLTINILVGGTPCQSFSVAGLRAGLADPRGNLALTFLAIVDRYRPEWVLWENVPGVHSSWSDEAAFAAGEESGAIIEAAGRACRKAGLDLGTGFGTGEFEEVDQSNDFDSFLAGLEQLGYGVATRILDAQYYRVAQRRRRVFVVGCAGGCWQRAAAVLFERESLRGDPAPSRETRQGVAGSIAKCSFSGGAGGRTEGAAPGHFQVAPTIPSRPKAGGGLGTDFDCDGGLISTGNGLARATEDGFRPIAFPSLLSGTQRVRTEDLSASISTQPMGVCQPITIQEIGKRESGTPMNGVVYGAEGDPMYTLLSAEQHGVAQPIAFAQNSRDEVREIGGNISGALAAEAGMKQRTYVAQPIGIDGSDVGFALRATASHSGVNTTMGAEISPTLRQHVRNNSNPITESSMLVAEVASTLRAASSTEAGHSARAGDKDENLVVHALRADGFDASEDGTGRGTPIIAAPITHKVYGDNASRESQLIPETVGTLSDGAHIGGGLTGKTPIREELSQPSIAWSLQERDAKGADSSTKEGHLIPTRQGGFFNEDSSRQVATMAVRRLTPRECERLQGFPDDYTLIPFRGKPASDGPRYKALGNSMAVPVMHWLGKRIEIVTELVGGLQVAG